MAATFQARDVERDQRDERRVSKTTRPRKSVKQGERVRPKRSSPAFPEAPYQILHKDPYSIYTKVSPLGIGSFGTVYECSKEGAMGSKFAVKTIKSDERHDEEHLKREIGFLAHCKSAWVCGFYEGFYWEEKLSLVLEYFEAGSVHDIMKMAKVTFKPDFIIAVTTQNLLTLDFLESRKVMHRDIKCGNMLVTRAGQSKLCDFGVSRLFNKGEKYTKTIIGTPYWMAPEIVMQTGYSYNADLWSLGISMIEMNDGNPPNHKIEAVRSMFIAQRRPPPVFLRQKDVPDNLVELLAKILVKEKDQRLSAKDILQDPMIHPVSQALLSARPKGASMVVRRVVELNVSKVVDFRQKTKFVDDDDIDHNTESELSSNGGSSFIRIGAPNVRKAPKKHSYRENLNRQQHADSEMDQGSVAELGEVGHLDSVADFNSFVAFELPLDEEQEEEGSQNTLQLVTLDEQDADGLNVMPTKSNFKLRQTGLLRSAIMQDVDDEDEMPEIQIITSARNDNRSIIKTNPRNRERKTKMTGRVRFSVREELNSSFDDESSLEDPEEGTMIFNEDDPMIMELHSHVKQVKGQLFSDISSFVKTYHTKLKDVRKANGYKKPVHKNI